MFEIQDYNLHMKVVAIPIYVQSICLTIKYYLPKCKTKILYTFYYTHGKRMFYMQTERLHVKKRQRSRLLKNTKINI
jgi:hypothetical protein